MELDQITSTGTWGTQANNLNRNFNKVGIKLDALSTSYETLEEAYQALSKNTPEPMTAADWAELSADTSNLEEGVIYRVAGTNSYTDYMWDGTSIITMATFTNSMDSTPTKDSQNTITSDAVYRSQCFISSAIQDITTIL